MIRTKGEAGSGNIVEAVRHLRCLNQEIARLRQGEHRATLDDWLARATGSRGARVSWSAHGGERSGVTAGIDEEGALLVRTGDGVERLVAGEVIWT